MCSSQRAAGDAVVEGVLALTSHEVVDGVLDLGLLSLEQDGRDSPCTVYSMSDAGAIPSRTATPTSPTLPKGSSTQRPNPRGLRQSAPQIANQSSPRTSPRSSSFRASIPPEPKMPLPDSKATRSYSSDLTTAFTSSEGQLTLSSGVSAEQLMAATAPVAVAGPGSVPSASPSSENRGGDRGGERGRSSRRRPDGAAGGKKGRHVPPTGAAARSRSVSCDDLPPVRPPPRPPRARQARQPPRSWREEKPYRRKRSNSPPHPSANKPSLSAYRQGIVVAQDYSKLRTTSPRNSRRGPQARRRSPLRDDLLSLSCEALPPLPKDDELNAWRIRIADSALRFARTCDVPHGMLPRCGALALS